MEELLLEFQSRILKDSNGFLSQESKNFPVNYTEEDKVKSEFMGLHAYYHDKNANEGFFDSNQNYVIQETLGEIQELIAQKDYEMAKYYVVSLQLLMGLEVKFYKVIYHMVQYSMLVSDFVNKEKYLGVNTLYTNRKRK